MPKNQKPQPINLCTVQTYFQFDWSEMLLLFFSRWSSLNDKTNIDHSKTNSRHSTFRYNGWNTLLVYSRYLTEIHLLKLKRSSFFFTQFFSLVSLENFRKKGNFFFTLVTKTCISTFFSFDLQVAQFFETNTPLANDNQPLVWHLCHSFELFFCFFFVVLNLLNDLFSICRNWMQYAMNVCSAMLWQPAHSHSHCEPSKRSATEVKHMHMKIAAACATTFMSSRSNSYTICVLFFLSSGAFFC